MRFRDFEREAADRAAVLEPGPLQHRAHTGHPCGNSVDRIRFVLPDRLQNFRAEPLFALLERRVHQVLFRPKEVIDLARKNPGLPRDLCQARIVVTLVDEQLHRSLDELFSRIRVGGLGAIRIGRLTNQDDSRGLRG